MSSNLKKDIMDVVFKQQIRQMEHNIQIERKGSDKMIWTGKKIYDPLNNVWSTGYWIKDSNGNWYPVWNR